MNILEIKNNVKICTELNTSGVAACVVVIPQNRLLTKLTTISSKELLATLTESAQLTILQNSKAEELFKWAALISGVNPSRISVMFEDVATAEQFLKVDRDCLKRLLLNTKIPEDLMILIAQHTDLESLSNLGELIASIQKIKQHLEVPLDWLYQHKDVLSAELFRSSFLWSVCNSMNILEDIVKTQSLFGLLNDVYEARKFVKLSYDNFVQLKEQSKSIRTKLNKVLKKLSAERQEDFIQYWLDNGQLLYDLDCIIRRIEEIGSGNFCQSRVQYIAFCYREVADYDVFPWQEDLIVYAIANKKKGFLRLLKEDPNLLKSVTSSSVLLKSVFYKKCININAMSVNDFRALAVLRASDEKLELLAGMGLTPKEFLTLYSASNMCISIYSQLLGMKVDDKISIIREFISNKVYINKDEVEALVKFLKKKKLSDWKLELSHIQNIDYKTTVKLLLCYEGVKRFIPYISNNTEALRICQNIDVYKDMRTIEEVRDSVLETDRDWLELKAKLKLSDEFVNDNKERVLDFIMREGARVVYRYLCRNAGLTADMRKLLSAELLGKFKELKYHDGDLEREIDLPLLDSIKDCWKENTSFELSGMRVWEEDNFLSVMQIGEVPKHTCLSWSDGQYSDCLLSNFDSNKKILFVSKGEQIICRAVIRLTKGSVRAVTPKKLEFADIGNEQEYTESQTQLTLFLEKAYLVESYRESKTMLFKLMWCLLRQKAKEMGVVLLCSDTYVSWQSVLTRINYHFYITASKAGKQYLDSFGGERVSKDECKYYKTIALAVKEDISKLEGVRS